MLKVLFLGSRTLGTRVLEWFLANPSLFFVVGVCPVPQTLHGRYWDKDPIDVAHQHCLPLWDISDLTDKNNFDIAISVNYHKIIKPDVLSLAPLGFWNIHHSHNLRIRGRHIMTHAILQTYGCDAHHFHGTTLHRMAEELDAGPIVDSRAFPIFEDDTAHSLFLRAEKEAFSLVTEWIPRICYGKVYTYEAPSQGVLTFKSKELPCKTINPLWDSKKISCFVRAFDFPSYSPAQLITQKGVFDLVFKQRGEYTMPINVKEKVFFTTPSIIPPKT